MSEARPSGRAKEHGQGHGLPPPVPKAVISLDEGVGRAPLGYANRLGYANLFTPNSPPGRSGNLVIAYDGVHLGQRCPVCNLRGQHPVSKTFSWYPRWLGLLFLPGLLLSCLGLLAVAIVILAVTKKAKVSFMLCPEHYRSRRKWQAIGTVFCVLAGCGVAAGFALLSGGRGGGQDWAWVGFLSMVVMLICAATAFHFVNSLKAVKVSDKTARLKGAGQAFLDTLPHVALRD